MQPLASYPFREVSCDPWGTYMTERRPTPDEIKQLRKKIEEEKIAIERAIGKVTTAWGSMEDSLCSLFLSLSGLEASLVGGVIFYAPTNLETRIRLVDSLVAFRFKFQQKTDDEKKIFDAWENLKGKINTLKNKRNAIAHGMIIHSTTHGVATQRPRLSPPVWDALRFWPQAKTGQHIGIGSNEILIHLDAVHRAWERVRNFKEAVRLHLKQPSGLNPKEAGKLRELMSLLDTTKSDQSTHGQEQQGTAAPDQSSQE